MTDAPDRRQDARELLRFCDQLHTVLEIGRRALPPHHQAVALAGSLQGLLDAVRTQLEVATVARERERQATLRKRHDPKARIRRLDLRSDEECRVEQAARKARQAARKAERKAARSREAAAAAEAARQAELRRFPWRGPIAILQAPLSDVARSVGAMLPPCEICGIAAGDIQMRAFEAPDARDGGPPLAVAACRHHPDAIVQAWAARAHHARQEDSTAW